MLNGVKIGCNGIIVIDCLVPLSGREDVWAAFEDVTLNDDGTVAALATSWAREAWFWRGVAASGP